MLIYKVKCDSIVSSVSVFSTEKAGNYILHSTPLCLLSAVRTSADEPQYWDFSSVALCCGLCWVNIEFLFLWCLSVIFILIVLIKLM